MYAKISRTLREDEFGRCYMTIYIIIVIIVIIACIILRFAFLKRNRRPRHKRQKGPVRHESDDILASCKRDPSLTIIRVVSIPANPPVRLSLIVRSCCDVVRVQYDFSLVFVKQRTCVSTSNSIRFGFTRDYDANR